MLTILKLSKFKHALYVLYGGLVTLVAERHTLDGKALGVGSNRPVRGCVFEQYTMSITDYSTIIKYLRKQI